jgi:hypothetical protein
MTQEEQLQATRNVLENLRIRLTHMDAWRLSRIEEIVCHEINSDEGTPCWTGCSLCEARDR